MKTLKLSMTVAGSLFLVCTQSMAGPERIPAAGGHGSISHSFSNLSLNRGQVRGAGFTGFRTWFVDFPVLSESAPQLVSSKIFGTITNGTTFNNFCVSSSLCSGTSVLNPTGLENSFTGFSCGSGTTSAIPITVPQNGTAQTIIQFNNPQFGECVIAANTVVYFGG